MRRCGFLASCLAVAIALGGARQANAANCPTEESLEALGFPTTFASQRGPTRFHTVNQADRTWIRARTDGRGTLGTARSARPAETPVDLSDHFLKIGLRLSGPGRIGGMEIRVGSGNPGNDYYLISIPLYTDPLFDPLQAGEWLTLTFGLGPAKIVGRPDRSNVRWISWTLRDDASGPIQVDWAELSAVRRPPKGVVSFTFDDGYAEHLHIAGRAMARHSFPGTAYVMPDQIDGDGYLRLEDLRALKKLGWDVAAHHATPLPDFDDAELQPVLKSVRDYLVQHGFDRGAGHLAYPLGRHDPKRVVPVTRRVFETARIAGAGPETLPPADRYRIRAVNVLGGTMTPEAIREIAEAAIEHRQWAVLMFHHLVPGQATNELEYNEADFARAVALVRETGVPVQTVSEVWRAWRCDAASLPGTLPAGSE